MRSALAELADLFLEQNPRILPELFTPFLVEAGAAQPVAEAGRVGNVDGQSFRLQRALQGLVELGKIVALTLRALVEIARDDLLQVGGQPTPSAGIGANPMPVPDVIADRAVFLHLVELAGLDLR